jgi:hypothetical protein
MSDKHCECPTNFSLSFDLDKLKPVGHGNNNYLRGDYPMNTRKHTLLAVAFVLLASLGTAMAQRMDQQGSALQLPPEPIGSVVKVNAIEVTDGTMGYDGQTKEETAFGYSFLGRTTGAFPGSFTLSMNCAPAKAIAEGKSELRGGSWTLPVYLTEVRGGYAGSLYGTIEKGSMTWDAKGTSATIYMVLNVGGGTQAWAGVGGYATFVGTLTVDEKTETTTLSGDMVFNTISAPPIL